MATVNITTADAGLPQNWQSPGGYDLQFSGIPRGEIVYQGSQVIPAKDAADINVWALTCTLPDKFCYKLVETRISATFSDSADGADVEDGVRVVMTDDDFSDAFSLGPPPFFDGLALPSTKGFRFQAGAEFWMLEMARWGTADPPPRFMKAQAAPATIVVNWMDASSDSSAAWTAFWYLRVFTFDISQLNAFAAHYPVRTIQG